MANQQELADYIKKVHIDLRLRSREIGPSAAWEEHCGNKEKLQKYANIMKELACVHWEKNNLGKSELSRILWVLEKIEWFFNGGGKTDFLEKETKLAQKFCIEYEPGRNCCSRKNDLISVLDVGSCYNPFSKFNDLKVTAIDLAPANEQVLKCDFLSVPLGDSIVIDQSVCKQLPKENYDVVLFSLLLEYIPSPEQRFICCTKASILLKKGGILIILTPDSKHASANSKLLKQWRLALASVSFLLLQTEKLKHLRCLIFVKATNSVIPQKWLSIQKATLQPQEAIMIPQDKNPYDELNKERNETMRDDLDNKFSAELFSCLVVEDDLFV